MDRLVAKEGVLYVIKDTGTNQADIAALGVRRKDLPPLKNVHQLFGWTVGPHGKRRTVTEDWQLLPDVKWAEKGGEYIPLVGSASNALKIFNKHCSTSHFLDSKFRNLLSGYRTFDGWTRCEADFTPDAAFSLADGACLVGLRSDTHGQSRESSPPQSEMGEVSGTSS